MTLEELFSGRNLTKTTQGIKSGIKVMVPERFFMPTDPTVNGNIFEWIEFDGQRDMAVIVSEDSPAHRVDLQGGKHRSAKMLRTFESQNINANKLRNLIVPGTANVKDEKGRQFVSRQARWFKQRQVNLIQASHARMLFTFEIHFNEKGEMLTSSTGATTSITVGIPAGQKGQLDILGSGAIIDASWAVSGTDILGHLDEIKKQMLELGGWEITDCYYGKNIPKYIAANDVCKEYINRTPSLAMQQIQQKKVPDGFQDLNWHDASSSYYKDAAGAIQRPLGDDEIVFTPSPEDETWWKYGKGSEMVPSGLGQVGADAEAMLGDLIEQFGEFAYAVMGHNPVSIEQFTGLNWLFVITATKAVCKGDVTP